MKKLTLSAIPIVAFLALVASTEIARSAPLQYHGGPVLESFTIHPLYWGYWSKEDIETQQAYLNKLAAYVSGERAPAGEEPTIQQYGVDKVIIGEKRRAAPNQSCKKASCEISRDQLAGPRGGPLLNSSIIRQAQLRPNNPLPAFGLHTLIVVFLPHHYVLTGCGKGGCGGAFHSSESATEFWAVVPQDQTPATIAHEVLEASANPADDNSSGWDEVADPCGNLLVTLKNFGDIQVPQIADNTRGGACNPTGYTPAQKRFNQIRFDIVTGGDDLRGDSSATASVSLPDGPQIFTLKSQSESGWDNNSDHVKTFAIAGPALPIALFGEIVITLTSHNGFAETDDNWNIQSVDITATGPNGSACVLRQGRNPLARLTGSAPSVTLKPRQGC